jgi:hypothetical protein
MRKLKLDPTFNQHSHQFTRASGVHWGPEHLTEDATVSATWEI